MIQLTFPTSHAEILKTFRAHLQSLDSDDFDQKVVVVIDSIVSNPGVRLPWEEMVQICKEERVWSLVDAAHAIGTDSFFLTDILIHFLYRSNGGQPQ